MKRQLTEWENIFTNRVSDKVPVSTMYKEHSQFNNKKESNLTEKWAKCLTDIFTKRCRNGQKAH